MTAGSPPATPDTVEVRRVIQATPERVFAAWTDPAQVMRWSAPEPLTPGFAEIDLRVGGTFRIHMREPDGFVHHAFGTYQEVDAPRLLRYTWGWEEERGVKDSMVTVEFNDLGGRTELVLRHAGLPTDEERSGHAAGWASAIGKLGALLD